MIHVRLATVSLLLPLLASCTNAPAVKLTAVPSQPAAGETLLVIPTGAEMASDAVLSWTVFRDGTIVDPADYEARESWLRLNAAQPGSYAFELTSSVGNAAAHYAKSVIVEGSPADDKELPSSVDTPNVTFTALTNLQDEEPASEESPADEAASEESIDTPAAKPNADKLAERVWQIIEELDVLTIDVEFTETSQKLATAIKGVLDQTQIPGDNGAEFRAAVSKEIKPIVEALRGSGATAWREFFSDFGVELQDRGFDPDSKEHMVTAYTALQSGLSRANDNREEAVTKATAYLMEKGYMPSGGGSASSRSGSRSRRTWCGPFCRHCRN